MDFFLFDNEFVKLKFVKIKGFLLVERISRVVNGKLEKVIEEYDILVELKCKEEMKGGCFYFLIKFVSFILVCLR